MVKPAYDDWQNDRLSERNIRTLTIHLDSMAEWMFRGCGMEQTYGQGKVGHYRNDLARETPAFRFVRDTADCSKHAELDRPSAISKKACFQRLFQYDTFDEVANVDSLDDWDSTSTWVIECGDYHQFLGQQIDAVMQMWESKLQLYGM